ncbi:MAG: hypothetical protein R3A44_17445 [Caldilineaceae bacterium]
MPIPPQAITILRASKFSSSGVDSGATSWLIQAQAIGDAPSFARPNTQSFSEAGRTAAAVAWNDVALGWPEPDPGFAQLDLCNPGAR